MESGSDDDWEHDPFNDDDIDEKYYFNQETGEKHDTIPQWGKGLQIYLQREAKRGHLRPKGERNQPISTAPASSSTQQAPPPQAPPTPQPSTSQPRTGNWLTRHNQRVAAMDAARRAPPPVQPSSSSSSWGQPSAQTTPVIGNWNDQNAAQQPKKPASFWNQRSRQTTITTKDGKKVKVGLDSPLGGAEYFGFGVHGAGVEFPPKGTDFHQHPPHDPHEWPIFQIIDCEGMCRPGPQPHPTHMSELGGAFFDTREALWRSDGSWVPPGERGENWHRLVSSLHWRVRIHLHNDCNSRIHHIIQEGGTADGFAFGDSTFARDHADLRNQFINHINTLRQRNLVEGEERRFIIFVVWAGQNEIQFFRDNLNLDLHQFGDLVWDFALAPFSRLIARAHSHPGLNMKMQEVARILGLSAPHSVYHNGGNDAAIEMMLFISGYCLSEDEIDIIANGGSLSAKPIYVSYISVLRNRYNRLGNRTKQQKASFDPFPQLPAPPGWPANTGVPRVKASAGAFMLVKKDDKKGKKDDKKK